MNTKLFEQIKKCQIQSDMFPQPRDYITIVENYHIFHWLEGTLGIITNSLFKIAADRLFIRSTNLFS